jgi:putative spermidine/putrescine transport system substrate-binding protein
MTEPQSFQQDCVALALRRYRNGEVSRRTLLAGLAALGALPASGAAQAQGTRDVVMVNWGGIANQGFGRFYGEPFMAEHPGWRVVQDSTGPSAGRIKGMVDSGRVTWDLCDSSASSSVVLGTQNLINRIDYGIIRREDVIDPGFALEWGAAPYSFSSVLAYDSSKFPTPPSSWADFWDLRRFPGTRLLRRDALATLDAAQMSMGKDPANLYPLDIRACIRRVAEIRRNSVYWTSGSESEQFLRTGEAVMGHIWHTRANVLERETNGRIRFIWNQGLLQAGIFVIPRGNPAGEMAQRVLASAMAKPEPQVGLLQFLGNGPTNPRAAALVPQEFRRVNPTDPDNAKLQVVLNGPWWGQNYTQANADLIDAITA